MGTMRTFLFSGLSSGLVVSLLAFSQSHGQVSSRLSDQPAQQAYYQPLSQEQYRQHVQATYDEFEVTPPARVTPSIQVRASRLLNRHRSEEQLNRSTSQQEGSKGANTNQDPFGERQSSPVSPVPVRDGQFQFDPFADPPADDANQEPRDPFGESQAKPNNNLPIQPPTKQTEPPRPAATNQNPPVNLPQNGQDQVQVPQSNPISNRPVQEPMRDPVLPQDAQFNPNPNQSPILEEPEPAKPALNRPNNVELNPDIVNQENQTLPPPGRAEGVENEFQSPMPSEGSIDYQRARPLKEQPLVPAEQNLAPPARNQPPIVQPRQFVPDVMPRQIYQSQPNQPNPSPPPLFKPDYQPIPGLPVQPKTVMPKTVVPKQVPPPPGVYVPPGEPSLIMETPADSVYSEVVVNSGAMDCQPCNSNGRPCPSSCQTCNAGCPNFYFSVFGGSTGLRDLEGRSGSRQMSADSGGGVGVALGRRNGRNLRTEAEFSYRHNNLSSFVLSPIPDPAVAPVDGELNSYAGMANAYWEFIDVPTRCFKPYVGAGIGFVSIDAEMRNAIGGDVVPAGFENDTSFAYQWIAGVNYKAYRNMDLFAEYRCLKADTFNVDPSVPGLGDRYTFETDNVFLGLRWKF